jgi:hypothetical protein
MEEEPGVRILKKGGLFWMIFGEGFFDKSA